MSRVSAALAAAALVAAAAGWFWWRAKPPQTPPDSPVAVAPAPAATASAPTAAAEPAVQYTLEATTQPLAPADIENQLSELLGRKAVASFLQVDDFPRRFVATVDNLGRSHAPPLLWPVTPTPDRFTVDTPQAGEAILGTDNAARYTPFVLLAETINIGPAVDLYVRMYPLLQREYEQLGYPGRSFNDRLIAVIDLLLATPAAAPPIRLQLTEVKGPIPSVRPWVRYQFVDPALESLSAGQKILVRVGPVNQRRLKGKLTEIRAELLKRAIRR